MIGFLLIGGIGFLLLLFSFFTGGDVEVDHDVMVEADAGDGPGIFSFLTVACFMMGFGGIGAIGMYYDFDSPASTGFGVVAGIVAGAGGLFFMRMLYGQQASSTITTENLVGNVAVVTMAIPANGAGKISCFTRGQSIELIATATQSIAQGERVKITQKLADKYLVKKETN